MGSVTFFDPSNSVNNSILDHAFNPEYSLLVDVLKHLHCGNIIKGRQPDVSPSDVIHYEENMKRKRRGVMENIVSAYSKVFTQGYFQSIFGFS